MNARERQLVRDGVQRAASRLAAMEERVAAIERAAFADLEAIERRLAALEQRAWLPSSAELQQARHAAITDLRSQGLSVSAISEATRVSRSRVAAVLQEAGVPVPERVTGLGGNSYPARRAAAARRRSIVGPDP